MITALESTYYGNPLWLWAAAAGVAIVTYLVLTGVRTVVLRGLGRGVPAGERNWRTLVAVALRRVTGLFVLIIAIYAGLSLLVLPAHAGSIAFSILSIALFVQAALIADAVVIELSTRRVVIEAAAAETVRNAMSLIQLFARAAVWSIAALLVLDNLGFDVTALVAGLGIGGIAIALAAQNILGDLFASLAIILDKPFVVGDFIIFGEFQGTVEKIGVKTTRLRSLSGEQLVCSNSDLLSSRLRNYQRMEERRISFSFGVTYETPFAKLERVADMVREIIENTDGTRFDRAHFASYGESSLDFTVVYYVLSPDYRRYMDIQQSINLALFARFEAEQIEFAYPTRTIHLASGAAPAAQPA